jgi:hypothetical protein
MSVTPDKIGGEKQSVKIVQLDVAGGDNTEESGFWADKAVSE